MQHAVRQKLKQQRNRNLFLYRLWISVTFGAVNSEHIDQFLWPLQVRKSQMEDIFQQIFYVPLYDLIELKLSYDHLKILFYCRCLFTIKRVQVLHALTHLGYVSER